MIVELFHNYFGIKPVVYRSILNVLVALVVFVFAGILCSSTAFAATCPGSPMFNTSGWNSETEMWEWTNCEGKVTWQFGRTLEAGCVNYYEGGWKYENSKPGKWGRWHGEGITKQCVMKRDVEGKYDRIASGRFVYGKFVQGKLIEYINGRKRVCEGKFDGINHPRGRCVWASLKSSNITQTSPLYNEYQKTFNKLSKSEKNSLQYELSNLDLYNSNIDGLFGNGTFKALKTWKENTAQYRDQKPNKFIKKFFTINDNANGKNIEGVPMATQQCGAVPTDCSDIELCHRATFNGTEWRNAPVFTKFIKEAKSRNLECEKIFSYDLVSSIDKNGLSFGAFPPQPKLTSAPVFDLNAIAEGSYYARRTAENRTKFIDKWTKELNKGPSFSGRYFLVRYGCGTACKWYRLIDLSNGEIIEFPIGGEEHMYHDLMFDKNSNLLKVIYPRNDYDNNLYHCVIKELSFYAKTSNFVTENEYIFPVFQGDHCGATADWQHVNKEFREWKSSVQQPEKDNAKHASSECNVANLSNCDHKQASKKPIVTSTKKSSGSANSLGKQIQIELKRVGCYLGAADGKIGPKSRSALFNFTNKAELEYDLSLFKNENFLNLLKDYPAGTCKGTSKKASTTSTDKKSPSTQSSSSNTAEIQALRREREQLEQSLLAIQNTMKQQEKAANAAYNNCLSQCMLNNRAGRGISNIFRGISACGNSCAPLKYGGAVKPPYWERRIQRMKTIDCTITQLSRNEATARCK